VKAAVYSRYGPPEVVHIQDVERPIPKDDEVLVKVHATTVAAGDVRMRKPDPFAARLYNGLFRPRKVTILGFEVAGEIEATGKSAKRFSEGDPVFAFTGFRFGAHAQYCCIPEAGTVKTGLIAPKPSRMTFEQAAAVPVGGLTALAFLRKGRIQKGSEVLVYGASGSVGTYAVQLAKHFGAQVTGVCSAANLDLVRSLGADRVIDYTTEEFTAGEESYDLIFDAVGKTSASHSRRSLRRNGIFLSANGSSEVEPQDLDFLREVVDEGKLTAVIDRRYPLEQIAEAHRYVETGHKKGNVVITIDCSGQS
jgi:NADPH:quinone reductase-like Zn-dependent oxidoreductase